MLILALLLQISSHDDAGLPYIKEPIGASCMIEVSQLTDETSDLTDGEMREAAKRKAKAISAALFKQAQAIDDLRFSWEKIRDEKKDLFEHQLISEKEWQETLALDPQSHIDNFIAALRKFPNCRMLENAYGRTAREARKAAGQ